MWSEPFFKESSVVLPDGRPLVVRQTFCDQLNDAGQTTYRRTVNRELIGEITEQEAIRLARQLHWII